MRSDRGNVPLVQRLLKLWDDGYDGNRENGKMAEIKDDDDDTQGENEGDE